MSASNKVNTDSEVDENDVYCIELSSEPIKFDPGSEVTDVFFDDSMQHVFAIRSGGVIGVHVKGTEHNMSFRMDNKGVIISIKFSPDMNVLAVQRTVTSVEFLNYNLSVLNSLEYSQSCKKNASILGFVWTHANEILFVTDHGVELFQVLPEKKYLKPLKSLNLNVNWFIFCPQSNLVLLSSGIRGNQMQALCITAGNLHKITKFEMEPNLTKSGKLAVSERDVALAVIYGYPSIIVLRHQSGDNTHSIGAALAYVYTVYKMMTVKKNHVLKLNMNGRFAINVVDNLIIVHHQASKTSMVFDIMLPGVSDGTVVHHTSFVPLKSIKPCTLKIPGPNVSEYINQSCELYSPNWVVFQPNIIIDAKLGFLWHIELKLNSLKNIIKNKITLVEFLMQRKNSKQILIEVIKDLVLLMPTSLKDIPIIFQKLNLVYRNYLENEIQSVMGNPIQNNAKILNLTSENFHSKILVDQGDIFSHIFSKIPEGIVNSKMIIWILLEYIRSLSEYSIPVQHYLHELIIRILVQKKAYYQLHQLLQYHIISDSKNLACLLLSLENHYPAAHQLALDMLKRLGNAHEEIIEVLLSKGQILPVLRYIRSVGKSDEICSRKFLAIAKDCNDPILYYTIYKFFEQRNIKLYNTTAFTKSERCEAYVQYFNKLF